MIEVHIDPHAVARPEPPVVDRSMRWLEYLVAIVCLGAAIALSVLR